MANRYDSMHKLFVDLRATLDEIEKFEEREREKAECRRGKSARDDGETDADRLKRYFRTKRRALLKRLVPDMKCKMCGKTHTKSRSWVIVTKRHLYRVSTLVEVRRVTLDDYVALRRAGACCLACWRTKFTVPPNARSSEALVAREQSHLTSQHDRLVAVTEQRHKHNTRRHTGVGSHTDLESKSCRETGL